MKHKTDTKNRELTRRDFIKTSAIAGSAALASSTSNIFAAGSDTIRVGLIGYDPSIH
ncbi:MAG: twin-arginine translocation signal domain-containing protein [Planctomycetota bacterium]|jgi:hypothetical protein